MIALKRWLKILLRIDPLVGMYVVNGNLVGVIHCRMPNEPLYLVRYFWTGNRGSVFEELLPLTGHDLDKVSFYYSRKEAVRLLEYRQQFQPKPKPKNRWEPPAPIQEVSSE